MELERADQLKINEFSKLNARLDAAEAKAAEKKREKEDLDDLDMEIELMDEDVKLPYKIGDGFVYLTQAQISERIEAQRTVLEEQLDTQAEEQGRIEARMAELKANLYARFGRENINLERD